MHKNALTTPAGLRKMAVRALASILLFISIYILCILFAIGLTILCGYLGFLLVMAYPSWITGALGLIMVGTGIIVLIFVIKFIFKRTEEIRPLRLEITGQQEPELFSLIEEIVGELRTSLPKRVYLSPEVNAGVFYDALFLSMFFPVRRNLVIGMGIINTHSKEELRAVIAHEFGHFSQRSMRIGSYVHHSNKVLYNMLYDNENFERTVEAWGDSFSYFKLAGALGMGIIKGMQVVLRKVHKTLNVSYFALSREMEYHADAVATAVAGSHPVSVSLMRLELAESSLNIVNSYHEDKINEGLKPLNVYPQLYFVMNHLAEREQIPVKNGLPEYSLENIWKVKKTKIVWTDQWSTHPSTEDRIKRINDLSISHGSGQEEIAVNILRNREQLEQELTSKIFEHHFEYAKAPKLTDFEQFKTDFLTRAAQSAYDRRFHSYYDDKMPYYKFEDELSDLTSESGLSFHDLFKEDGLSDIIEEAVLDSDLNLLEGIKQEPGEIRSFDYDGMTYEPDDCPVLIGRLQERLAVLKQSNEERELNIFEYFKSLALQANRFDEWKTQCQSYKKMVYDIFRFQDAYVNLSNAGAFMNMKTPFGEIASKMEVFTAAESELKDCMRLMLQTPAYITELGEENLRKFETYISETWIYFEDRKYRNDNLDNLFALIRVFTIVYYEVGIGIKKELLGYYSSLLIDENVSLSA